MSQNWIADTIREQKDRGIYGRVTLHFEAGDIQRVTVEQTIKKPESEKGVDTNRKR